MRMPSPPPPPEPKPTPPMPDMQSPQVLEAQRANTAAILARSGRRSTILSQGEGAPAGTPYSARTLSG